MPTRRHFLKSSAFAAAAIYPLPLMAAENARKIRIGLITDIHKDLVPDADQRLEAFITDMTREKVDAIMQLGDFCVPKPTNQAFLDIFNRFKGPRHHVLGNHDMDGGFKREQTMAFWGMPKRFHSFDLGGYHFIILDANDRPEGWKGGYPHFIAADQMEWLKQDLAATSLPTFVFSHQSFERPTCIDNQKEIRAVFENAKTADGKRKVAACFNGHWHINHQRVIEGIPYVHLNSASYYYMGTKDKAGHVDPELEKKFPLFAWNAGYEKPLYTILEIDPAASHFTIRAMHSPWLGPSPQELNYKPKDGLSLDWVSSDISAGDWKLPS